MHPQRADKPDLSNETDGESDAIFPWRVGVHTSTAGSLDQAAERAHQVGCTAFQIFSSSPRMWRSRDVAPAEAAAMQRLRHLYDLNPLVIHASYLVNLASPDEVIRRRSLEAFRGEIRRAAALQADYLVLHPGSSREGSPEQGIRTLVASLREALATADPGRATILIENTCCQGNVLGGTFEQLQEILSRLDGLPVDCCMDTAHCFAAGMDVSTAGGLEAVIHSLRRTVGLERVRVIHANDSRAPLGSRRDRHEHIGRGGIGLEGFRRIVNHPELRDKVFILETPIEADGDDRRNLEALRSLRETPASRKHAPQTRRNQRDRNSAPLSATAPALSHAPRRRSSSTPAASTGVFA